MTTLSREELAAAEAFAVNAAFVAGQRTLAYFQTPVAIDRKGDGTPVTRADREAEQSLRSAIKRQFPDDGLLGEEYGEDAGTSGRTWILDPIDGTKSFIHGVPLYAILVALAVDGRAQVGVIHLPGLGETVSAFTGGCCRWNGRRAQVSSTARLDQAMVLTSDFPDVEQPGPRGTQAQRLYRAAGLRRTWGDAYGYALVATGRADVMVDPIVEPWDVAAVQPIIEEAGGRFTSFDGAESFSAGHAVGTNGLLHDAVLQAFSGASAER
ncbi:MAG: histidinol-phosphatase [Acidobacteriota bacterium]